MKNIKILIGLFLILLTGCSYLGHSSSLLERETIENHSNTRPHFSVEYLNIANSKVPKKGKTHISTNIPYPELRFEKPSYKGWQARYNGELRLSYKDIVIDYYTFTGKTIVVKNYKTTTNPRFSALRTFEYSLKQAKYKLELKINNRSTNESSYLEMPFVVRNIKWGNFDISDPVIFANKSHGKHFFDSLHDSAATIKFSPLNSQALNPFQPINVLFEIYFPSESYTNFKDKKVVVRYELLLNNKKTVLSGEKLIKITPQTQQREVVDIELLLPDNLESGDYTLVLYAVTNGLRSHTLNKSMRFYSPTPRSSKEMDRVFGAMRYVPDRLISKKFASKKIKNEDKLRIFIKFWQKQGPDALKEFRRRINYTDRHLNGYRSEQGRIYIRFGGPDNITEFNIPTNNVITNPYDSFYGNKNYEVWHYYNLPSAIQGRDYKMFIFQKNKGFRNKFNMSNMTEFNNY